MNIDEAKTQLRGLRERILKFDYKAWGNDAVAIEVVLQALDDATLCRSCHGAGRRWYSLWGMGTCEDCKGSGKRS